MAATEFNMLCLPMRLTIIFLKTFFFPKKFLTIKLNLQFLLLYLGFVI